ncbi:ATPase AAA [Salinisphaera orenii MK-B5]|uniref:ATPase AAA n=1 Tax=Salinisphaera orenii MK-B5 TaxID=856730 RepID=A0A423PII2_9GAMM|nr:sigma-54-dependent Fis family transcriptional regulator [Salinisphaera orenii]ROO25364.1 ATPase AAA [Salinisphaera orenii MK-B5]
MTQPHSQIIRRVLDTGQAVAQEQGERLIQQSWLRCAGDHGLAPGRNPGIPELDAAQLRERRERVGHYLDVARAGMHQLYPHIAPLGYITMLADSQGATLECLGDTRADSPFATAGLRTGTVWNEAAVGTNGIGTCIAEQRTLTCHRDDHFYAGNLDLSCTAAPLRDPQGRVAAVLDISALSMPGARDSQHLARHLTSLYARLIEDSYFGHHFRDRWLLRLSRSAALVDHHADLMLALDDDGCVVGANTGARRLFDPHAERGVVGHGIGALFRDGRDRVHALRQAESLGRLTTWHDADFHAALTQPRRARAAATRVPIASHRADALHTMAGDDPRMMALTDQARRLAAKPIDLLVQGETGCGKEVLARAIHATSPRANQPFVAINCAALPESLIESELFGYAAGTFTGARRDGMTGRFVQADGGTLFLDEIGDMPLDLQTRLLRVLAEREVLPLGSDTPIALDVRVITATHRDIEARIAAGTFRADLYYRLAGGTLTLPALRERTDLDWLIDRVIVTEARALAAPASITAEARAVLHTHDWPGNIRELRNVLRFALALADEHGITANDLPNSARDTAANAPGTATSSVSPGPADAEPDSSHAPLIARLRRCQWNVTQVARELGVARSTIYRRMARLDIVAPKYRH